ncbi:tetratricopeptide repeat protein [Streptomyces sp. CA-111067]|uniref:tetratricopeptide repeat protein n=1 Tax=Streptomyces sp. CA-111067 TaxID=3240046 RepID=UPI003D995611
MPAQPQSGARSSARAPARPSMQELIRRRRRGAFVGRRTEIAAFRANLTTAPEDEAHRFLFHVRGAAGVGKSSLLRQWESAAHEQHALTAYVDEGVTGVLDAMAALSAQFGQQDRPFKAFDKLHATYRERRHEAETAAGVLDAPTAGSVVAAQVSLAGIGLLPGLGPFVGAMDPGQVAQGADRIRALLSSRFRNEHDVRLVMEPLAVLTPVLVADLAAAAANAPWTALFFDTYERTGPLLDRWLHDLVLDDRYGQLPANLVITLAGQGPLAPAVWSDHLDLVEDVPLDLFTEAEARQLLADKGVIDESAVETVLRLSGRLPVLVSMLAEARPAGAEAVDDPSDTAVERFLKWVDDPARRDAALSAALPRRLDEDVFRAAVAPEAAGLYAWLRSLPFVNERAGQAAYHDVVRTVMLRLRRTRSPQGWREQHGRLSTAFGGWRAEAEAGLSGEELWVDGQWLGFRLEETYHLLCANPRQALPVALADAVAAAGAGLEAVRRWAGMLAAAGADRDDAAVADWGRRLGAAVEEDEGAVVRVLSALLGRGRLPDDARARAFAGRARARRVGDIDLTAMLADCDSALRLGLDTYGVQEDRGWALIELSRWEEAGAAFGRALAHDPEALIPLQLRAICWSVAGRHEEALSDLDMLVSLAPTARALGQRATTNCLLGRHDEAIEDYERACELDSDDWPSASYASIIAKSYLARARPEDAVAACDVSLAPGGIDDSRFRIPSHARRATALVQLGRYEEALPDLDMVVLVRRNRHWQLLRAMTYRNVGRYEAALDDLAAVARLDPDDRGMRRELAGVYRDMGRWQEAAAVCDRLLDGASDDPQARELRTLARLRLGRPLDALADFDALLDTDPAAHMVRVLRAQLLSLLGREEDARSDLDAVAAVEPDALDLLLVRCRLARRAGSSQEARAALARLRVLLPGSVDVLTEQALAALDGGGPAPGSPVPDDPAGSFAGGVTPLPRDLLVAPAQNASVAIIACAGADWPTADDRFDMLLAAGAPWHVLAGLECDLAWLAERAPAGREPLDARRERVAAARRALENRARLENQAQNAPRATQ